MHQIVDNSGLKFPGPGEWQVEKHGARTRRSWRKLHIGLDADTGEIVASELIRNDIDEASRVGPLLDQITGPVASFTSNGACDTPDVYAAVAAHNAGAAFIEPRRRISVASETSKTDPTPRDHHRTCIAERGRIDWQRAPATTGDRG
jgi:hypothetical protein